MYLNNPIQINVKKNSIHACISKKAFSKDYQPFLSLTSRIKINKKMKYVPYLKKQEVYLLNDYHAFL